jgi:hypothetical protein
MGIGPTEHDAELRDRRASVLARDCATVENAAQNPVDFFGEITRCGAWDEIPVPLRVDADTWCGGKDEVDDGHTRHGVRCEVRELYMGVAKNR